MSKTQELIQQLNYGVQALFASDRYAEYLRFLASFPSYSASNCYLIFSQMPNASLICSYTDWNSKHHRQVKRGSKAIKILAPHVYKETDENGVEHEKLGFHAASCFDVSQTYSIDDTPLPSITQLLDTDVDGYGDLLDVLLRVSPVPIDFLDIEGEARGYFSPSACRIVVQKDMSEGDTLRTTLHEQAHAWVFSQLPDEKYNRRESEVIAESVCYVVANHIGLCVDDMSFGYVASWSSDKTLPELRNCLDTIRKISELMIGKIEDALYELREESTAVA